jgi:redox-sensitive bicupin YhaK (pirin superfamily)
MSTQQRAVEQVSTAHRQREGAGFIVRRPFPSQGIAQADPFLMLDEMGPITYAPGQAVGAPDHPHRGFETVSYILAGEVEHELGAAGRVLEARLQDCVNMTVMRGVLREIIELVRTRASAEAADRVAAAAQAANTAWAARESGGSPPRARG